MAILDSRSAMKCFVSIPTNVAPDEAIRRHSERTDSASDLLRDEQDALRAQDEQPVAQRGNHMQLSIGVL